MPLKQLSAFRAYEATIYQDRRSVHLYALPNFSLGVPYFQSVSDRESYLVQKFENIPADPTLASAFLREAFKEFFKTIMQRHPDSAFGLTYAGHGTGEGGMFERSISPVDAQLMLRAWADTYQGKIEFIDFGGNCAEGMFRTLLNMAPFANYIVASQLNVGGYMMDDWTYEKYQETKEEEQLPLQLVPGRPIVSVLKILLDRRRREYEYSRNYMTQNRVAQHLLLYDSSSFEDFALALLQETEKSPINFPSGIYDMYTQLMSSGKSGLARQLLACVIYSVSNRDFFAWTASDQSRVSLNTTYGGENPQYLKLQPSVGGSIISAGGQQAFLEGTSARLDGSPDPGFDFANWTGSTVGSENPLSLVMDGNKTLGAVFKPICVTLSAGGQAFTAQGGTGAINITANPDCAWTISNIPFWVTLLSAASGTGSGVVSFQVAPSAGAALSGTFNVGGMSFIVEQQSPPSVAGLTFVGSVSHLAAEENWATTFTLVNKSTALSQARFSLFGDPGGQLTLPVSFPQQSASSGPLLAASFDRTLAGNASLVVTTAGPQTPPVLLGSAQLAATGAVDGFAIFHHVSGQEAVVPLETRKANSYLLAFDNTGGVVLGVALNNVSPIAARVPVVIRNESGVQISSPGTTITLDPNGHTSFVLSDPLHGFAITANKRGTIEFDTPPGGQISVLGIRTAPFGTINTFTTIPALANVGTSGGSIAQIATGNGWQTTFVLVNTGGSAANAHLKFFADNGSPLSLPLTFPQSGGAMVASSVDQLLAPGATLTVQSAAPLSYPQPTIGSAQLTTDGKVGGFVIFRLNTNGQEAVVPLESRNASAFVLAFDNTVGTSTGIGVNSVSAQLVNIAVVVRDDAGKQIASDVILLAPNGHYAFTLASDKYPQTANIRGTIEFGTPANGQIGVLGIRMPVGSAHTFTTLPSLSK